MTPRPSRPRPLAVVVVKSNRMRFLRNVILPLFTAVVSGVLGFEILSGPTALVAVIICGVSLILCLGGLLYDPERIHSEI